MKKSVLTLCGIMFLLNTKATIINIPGNYPDIQQGIDSSTNGDTIIVEPGGYYGFINFHGKDIILASQYLLTGDTSYISSTILSTSLIPELSGSIVTFENGETSSTQLIGFTLAYGTGNLRNIGFDFIRYGGGIYINNASPRLSHLKIKGNFAECGGGIFMYLSSALIENCEITNNVCNSINFAAPDAGGAIACWNTSNAIIRNCIIQNNTVSTAGAGIYALTSKVSIINCLLSYNYSMSLGSAFYVDSWSNFNIINCTVYGNHCDYGPGIIGASMMYCIDSAHVHINNSIFQGNHPTTIVCQFNYSRNDITISHSDFEGGIDSIITNNNGNNVTINWLTGNFNSDPKFVNTSQNNFHLLNSSPCINNGDTAGLVNITLFDLDNNNRFVGVIDMGCFENQQISGIMLPLNEDKKQLLVYPNPSKGIININYYNFEKEFMADVLNSTGQAILSKKTNNQSCTMLDLSSWSKGIYFIIIRTENKVSIRKIILE